ncbi:putative Transient receptor potential cation channel subfamily A member 1 [Hypsibius exemplaris]|uniref:Transient receptor potential cation channel subfamily A member 1 n=1 Tax=Hypsibius exemplaris TaxID=2072580 RepID=A0A1W0WG99_HYPEX|nr:putative Transient receptor potential cation channel subfamily A member 1 [Hypsibius exemplaris]
MFDRLRKTLLRKTVERELGEPDEESDTPLNRQGGHPKGASAVVTHDGSDRQAEEQQLSGLTNVGKFGQILGSIVLDCGVHQLPRSATTHPLHWAVRESQNAVLVKLLENETWRWNTEGVAPGEKGERPLHVAAEVDNVEASKILIRYGSNPHGRQLEYYGLQPVQVAASKGAIKVLTYLTNELVTFKGQRFISTTDLEGSTALHWAVLGGEIACVKHLLEQGAAVDFVQTKGPRATPLHFACIEASLPIVQLMAEIRPIEFRKALAIPDIQGCTPLHRAVVLDRVDLVKYLLDKGAQLDLEDHQGRTPIILAAIREAWLTVDVLIDWGANPFACNRIDLRHVGHHAAMVGSDPRPCRALNEMLKRHPEWKRNLDAVDSFGYTALQYAAGYGHVQAFHGLLAIGASITARSEKDKTVLHYAAKYGQLEMVKTLLESPAGISILNAMDHKGRSALHLAATYGHHEVAEFLLSKGAFCFPVRLFPVTVMTRLHKFGHFVLAR